MKFLLGIRTKKNMFHAKEKLVGKINNVRLLVGKTNTIKLLVGKHMLVRKENVGRETYVGRGNLSCGDRGRSGKKCWSEKVFVD
jgi:hypothetical protein